MAEGEEEKEKIDGGEDDGDKGDESDDMEGVDAKTGERFGLEVGVFEIEKEGDGGSDDLESGGETGDGKKDGDIGGDDEEGDGEEYRGAVNWSGVFEFLFKFGVGGRRFLGWGVDGVGGDVGILGRWDEVTGDFFGIDSGWIHEDSITFVEVRMYFWRTRK